MVHTVSCTRKVSEGKARGQPVNSLPAGIMRQLPGPGGMHLPMSRGGRRMKTAIFAAAAGVILAVAACSTTNHDTQAPATDIVVKWWRLDTPPSVVTEYFACFGTDGLILDQGDGNVSVTPDDKMCTRGGAHKGIWNLAGNRGLRGRLPAHLRPGHARPRPLAGDDAGGPRFSHLAGRQLLRGHATAAGGAAVPALLGEDPVYPVAAAP